MVALFHQRGRHVAVVLVVDGGVDLADGPVTVDAAAAVARNATFGRPDCVNKRRRRHVQDGK